MATINTNLAGVTSGSQYASAGNNTIYTNLPFNTAGTTATNVTFFVGASASIDILYNQNFRIDSTVGFHELFGNIEVQGVSSDYTVSSWYGKVQLTHKTSGQVISFQLTKPQNAASNSGVNVEFLDGAIAFTSNVNAQGVWTVWATQGGTDTSTWGAGGLATQVPGTFSPGATPLDLASAANVGYLNYSVNSSDVSNWTGQATTITLNTTQFLYNGTSGDDIFIAPLEGAGQLQTLLPQDTINGGGGTNDILYATIRQDVSPSSITGIETIQTTHVLAAATVNASNTTGLTTYVNNASSVAGTVSGISKNVLVGVQNTGQDFTVTYNDVTGTADAATVYLSGVTAGALSLAGIETLTLDARTSASTLGTLTAANATTLNITGSQNLTVTNNIAAVTTTVNAGTATGNLTLGFAGGNHSITGGTGNDSFTLAAVAGNASVAAGDGNDTITFAGQFTNADTVNGGNGTNTLVVTSADATGYVAPVTATVSNIQTLAISDALATSATLTPANIASGISALVLRGGSAAGGGQTINALAGNYSVTVGNNNAAQLLSDLTVNDTGIGVTDALTLTNAATGDAFHGRAVSSGGYETLNVNTGAVTTAAQTLGAVTLTPDLGASTSFVATGINGLTVGAVTANTITAAGLTGTAGLTMGAAAVGATAITGSGNADTLLGSSVAATIDGGAGNDTILDAGAVNDVIRGGVGNDTITSGGGNDNIDGGADNDRIDLGTSLTASDTVSGGEGTNTVVLGQAAASAAIGSRLTNFQTVEFSATAIAQDMSVFTGTTFTGITQATGAGVSALTITNASQNVATLTINQAGAITTSLARANNTLTDAITVNLSAALANGSALTLNNEETITLNASTFGSAGTTLNGTQLTSLTLNSTAATNVFTIAGATNPATLNASGVLNTATMNIDASSSTVALTFTGGASTSGNTTLTSGSGNDIINAGIASASSIIGGSGNDSITGSRVNDTLDGGIGNDTILAGEGNDTIVTSAGTDSIDGGGGTNTLSITAAGSNISGQTISNVTGLALNNLNATMTLAQFNGFTTGLVAAGGVNGGVTLTTNGTLTGKGDVLNYTLAAGDNTFTANVAATTVSASSGLDVFNFTAAQLANTSINGGSAVDIFNVTDNAVVNTTTTTLINVETLNFANTTTNASWTWVGNQAANLNTTVNATGMTTGVLSFDGSANATATGTFTVNTAGSGNHVLTGGAGDDTLNGATGNDIITGGAGADRINAGAGTNAVNAGNGTDTITVNTASTNTVNLSLGGAANLTTVNITAGAVYGTTIQTSGNALDQQATVLGAIGAVMTVQAGGATALFTGGTGADSLTGSTGSDTLVGGDGNDVLTTGGGNDQLTGGAGADTFNITTAGGTAAITDLGVGADVFTVVNGASLNAAVTANWSPVATSNTAAGTANVVLTAGNGINVNMVQATGTAGFTITASGNASSSTLTGSAQADSITGGNAADSLVGGLGADTITGNQGNDTIQLGLDVVTDRVNYANTAANNGSDAVSQFVVAAGGDVLNFGAFTGVNGAPATFNNIATNPGAATNIGLGGVVVLADIAGGQDILTAAGLTTALAGGGEYSNIDMGNNQSAIAVTYSGGANTNGFAFYLTSDGAGAITATAVGTVGTNATWANAVAGNFLV